MSRHAHDIAIEYPIEEQSVYLEAAQALRIPYWDWGVSAQLPLIMTQQFIEIKTPSGPRNITNPLYQYAFPSDMDAENLFPSSNGTAILVPLMRTVKHYNESLGDSDFDSVSAELAASSTGRLQTLYRLLVTNNTWATFTKGDPGLELLHGSIHNTLGGLTIKPKQALGHMTVTEMSAFDPSFWLHHANVDRYTAIWQVLHDDAFVESTLNEVGSYYQPRNTTDTQDTPLAPFHSGNMNSMWTAATSRNISGFGYTYPELANSMMNQSRFKASVLERINQLYNPDPIISTNSSKHALSVRNTNIAHLMSNIHVDTALYLGVNNLEMQWYLRVRSEDQMALSRLAIFFFVGEAPLDNTEWSRAQNLVGSYTPLVTSGPIQNALDHIDIPCTHTIAAAVDRGILRSMQPEAALPFFKSHVTGRIMDPHSHDSSVRVSIVSQSIQPRRTLMESPQYGHLEEHDQLHNIEMMFV